MKKEKELIVNYKNEFDKILSMVDSARSEAEYKVNKTVIDLY